MDASARQQWRQQQQAAAAQSRPVERTNSNDRRQPKRTAAMAAEVEFDREEEPDEMPSDQRGGMLSLGKFRRRCSAVGADFQADDVPFERPSIRPPPAAPPLCRCNKPAVWVHNRWWCASGAVGANAQNGTVALGTYAGCSYEATPPPLPTAVGQLSAPLLSPSQIGSLHLPATIVRAWPGLSGGSSCLWATRPSFTFPRRDTTSGAPCEASPTSLSTRRRSHAR